MKKPNYISLLLLLNLFFLIPSAQNVADLDAFEKAMKPGAVLIYDVTMSGKKYQLIATIKKIGEEIAFDWKNTDPINKAGNVLMNVAAVSKADALFNDFTIGESKLEKETGLFISKKIFDEVRSNFQATIKVNGQSDTATIMSSTTAEFGININGEFLSVPGWELQGGSEIKYTIGVMESQKFPLITRMDLGWTLLLTEIKNP